MSDELTFFQQLGKAVDFAYKAYIKDNMDWEWLGRTIERKVSEIILSNKALDVVSVAKAFWLTTRGGYGRAWEDLTPNSREFLVGEASKLIVHLKNVDDDNKAIAWWKAVSRSEEKPARPSTAEPTRIEEAGNREGKMRPLKSSNASAKNGSS